MEKYNQLLSINADSKTSKGTKKGFLTGILYLSPSKKSGSDFCASSSPGCESACLDEAGRGAFNSVQLARYKKSKYFLNDRSNFMLDLIESIIRLQKKANNKKLIPVIRLNGTSDLIWESIRINLNDLFKRKYIIDNIDLIQAMRTNKLKSFDFDRRLNIFELFSNITFYDYTKHPIEWRNKALKLNNYSLTFSRCEDNENKALSYLINGFNSAFVFKNSIPKKYKGFKVINGDETDLRFLDEKNVIVGLIAKGKAKNDKSGFVINN